MTTTQVSEIVRNMPKVELHKHLEGSVRSSTVQELQLLLNNKHIELSDLIVESPTTTLAECFEKFWLHQQIFVSYDIIERVAYECVIDSAKDNVRILELRYSPYFMAIGHSNLTYQGTHNAILKGIERACAEQTKIIVGLIGIIDRNLSFEEAQNSMNFIIENKSTFVGVDLANDETKYDADIFIPLFHKAKNNGLKITIHCDGFSPKSVANIKQAVLEIGATRIGHGTKCVEDMNVMHLLVMNDIHMEVCPSCNWLCGLHPSLKDHPVSLMNALGLNLSLSLIHI